MRVSSLVVGFCIVSVWFASHAAAQIPTCQGVEFAACGGELTGTWIYTGIRCFDPPDMSAAFNGCEGVTTVFDGKMEGALTFMADGNFVDVQTSEMDMEIHVPNGCLQGATCQQIAGTDGRATDTHCIISHQERETDTEIGVYSIDGSTATLSATDGDVDQGNFCVTGDEVAVEIVDAEAGVRLILTQQRAR